VPSAVGQVCNLCVVVILAAAWCAAAARPGRAADGTRSVPATVADDAKVEQFLTRLGLTDLQVIHLENALAKELPPRKKAEIARRLADLYAALMLGSAEDKDRSRRWLHRIESLVEKFPEANTPALKVSLLQADYDQAELEVSRWIADPGNSAVRDTARAAFAAVVPSLQARRLELEDAVELQADLIDEIKDADVRAAKEKELAQLEGVLRRATYFAAWAHYYHGLLMADAATAAAQFKTARLAFRTVLGIPDDDRDADDFDAGAFDLESAWQTRTLIGLGMAEAAAGNLDAARRWFTLLEDPRVPLKIRDEAGYWRIQGLINAKEYKEALRHAEKRVDAFAGTATPGKVSLCASLVRTGFGGKTEPTDDAKALGMLGISGLAKLRQFPLLRRLMAEYSIEPDRRTSFLLQWLKGQDLFAAAEKTKRADDYRTAVEGLEAAMAAGKDADRISVEQCRYTLAWCHSRLGEHEKAAKAFKDISRSLRTIDDETAAAAAWKAVESYRRLAENDQRYVFSAIESLEAIRRDFPDHPQTQKVDYYITKLRRAKMSPEEVFRKLDMVARDNPNYPAARYDICVLRHEQWSNARRAATGGRAEMEAAAAKLYQAVEIYLAAARERPDPERTLRCLLLAVDAALGGSPPDAGRAKAFLDKAARPAAAMPASAALVADFHYRSFQWAKIAGDEQGFREHAAWLVDHAKGTRYQLPALVATARHVDAAVSSAAGQQRRPLEEKACSVYKRLATILGDSPEAISSQKNALVANSKLARYLTILGRYAEAAERMEKILAAYPKDKGYLRRAGLAHYNAKNYEQSVEHWRTLLAGLPKESDDWYEAKYYQLACLAELDKPAARKVFDQFALLHPKLGPPAWREKFEGLKKAFLEQ